MENCIENNTTTTTTTLSPVFTHCTSITIDDIVPVLSTILVDTSHTSARHSEDRCSYCGLPVVCTHKRSDFKFQTYSHNLYYYDIPHIL